MVAISKTKLDISPNSPISEFELSRFDKSMSKIEKYIGAPWVGRNLFDSQPTLLCTHVGYSSSRLSSSDNALLQQYYSDALQSEEAFMKKYRGHICFGIGVTDIMIHSGEFFSDSTLDFIKKNIAQRNANNSFFLTTRRGKPYPFCGGLLLGQEYSSFASKQHDGLCTFAASELSAGGSFAQHCAAGTYRDAQRCFDVKPRFDVESSVYYPETELLAMYGKTRDYNAVRDFASSLHKSRKFVPGKLFQ